MLAGLSDLTEIAIMRSMQTEVRVVGVYQPNSTRREFFGVPVFAKSVECDSFDVIVLTSMEQTRELALELESDYGADRCLIPNMLLNMNYRNPATTEES